ERKRVILFNRYYLSFDLNIRRITITFSETQWCTATKAVSRKEADMGNEQKTVIVTGASQGIGAGVVQAFLDRGYNVVANSRNITKSAAFTESAQLALVDGNIGDSAVAAKVVGTAISRF